MNWKVLYTGIVAASLLFSSCTGFKTKFPQAAVSDLPEVDIKIKRYGKTLFELDTTDFQNELKKIKPEFPLFLDADLNDSTNILQLYNYVADTQLFSIYQKSVEVFPNSRFLETELQSAFSRFKYFFPEQQIPVVYTYISDMYYEQPIWIQDSIMVVAIDLYLGNDFPLYAKLGLPYYKVMWMQPQSLTVDMMKAMYFDKIAPAYRPQSLLDRMIDGGKLLAFLDAMFPDVADEVKISYTTQQLEWAKQNQENIWAFLISKQLLYSKDHQTQAKLIQDGPFTTGFGNESPSRLGVYVGWQIVLSYLKNNPNVSLEDMLKMTDSQKLLQDSGYKPM